MLPRTLIVVGSSEDRQASGWYDFCRRSWLPVVFAEASCLGRDWWLQVDRDERPGIVTRDGRRFSADDSTVCWYLRTPTHGPSNYIATFQLLHRCLSLYAYPLGNYF